MRKFIYIYLFTGIMLFAFNEQSIAQYNLGDTLISRPWNIKRIQSLANIIPDASIYEFKYTDNRLLKKYDSTRVEYRTWKLITKGGPANLKILINHGDGIKRVYTYSILSPDTLVLKQCEGFKRMQYRETLTLRK